MIDLVFADPTLARLEKDLLHPSLESAAMLLAVPVDLDGGNWRLLVREIHVVPAGAYQERSALAVTIDPAFGLSLEKKARLNGWSIVYCHTHPNQQGVPCFSSIDDRSEGPLGEYARNRVPGVPHVSLLHGTDRTIARVLGSKVPVRVWQIGASVVCHYDPAHRQGTEEVHDRQIRAFGSDGQIELQRLRVGIVGLGGTGSVVAQQLAHLGIQNYVLIDPDIIETTNLNRVVGATRQDVNRTLKVDVAARMIREQQPDASIAALSCDVLHPEASRTLRSADFIFCCTDSQASRHLLNQLVYQYYIPLIDVGVAITVSGSVARVDARATMLAPGLPCLWCMSQLDPAVLRRELATTEQRRADPYFTENVGIEQPAIVSINSTASSLAVTMMLSAVTGLNAQGRFLAYDAGRGRMTTIVGKPDPQCNFCSPQSTAGTGDSSPLPVRQQ